MEGISASDKETMKGLLEENKLTHDSILFRFTSQKYLINKDGGTEYLKVNPAPVEMVVDAYEDQGHVFMAKDIGPGLSFLTEAFEEYQNDERICVSVKIEDLIAQGGQIYKVTSLPAYINAFFFTLPAGDVKVKRV